MGKNNARITDVESLIAAGIEPTSDEYKHSLTRRPTRASIDDRIFQDTKRIVRLIDEQNATSRFKWFNLPCNITGEELERLLWYKGSLCFFYFKELDEFFFMPYALNGTIDFYGRYNSVNPIPMSSGGEENNKTPSQQQTILSKKVLNVIRGIPLNPVDPFTSCVILDDHVKQLSECVTPRQQLNDSLCCLEAELLSYMRTNALAGSGVRGLRVGSDDESAQVCIGNQSLKQSAINGEVWTPMIANLEFQELLGQGQAKMEEYFQAMQAVDNLRLSTYGLGEGQLFEKKAHMLQTEADKNQSNVGVVLESDLAIRQNFCTVVNAVFGLGIWCEPNESYAGQDINGDGKDYSDDPSGSNSAIEGGSSDDTQV